MYYVVGVYFDCELIVVYKYFSDRSYIFIFEKIKKGINKKGLLKWLDNIVWDMVVFRFMEKLIIVGGGGCFFILLFFMFDFGFR